MRLMRFIARLCVVSIFSLPFVAFALAQDPPLIPSLCPKGSSTGDPQGTVKFTAGGASDIRAYLKKVIACPSACFNERITLAIVSENGKNGLSFKTVTSNQCADRTKTAAEQNPPRGCAKDQSQPKVTIDVPAIVVPFIGTVLLKAQTIGPKSRCSAEAITTAADSVFDKLETEEMDTIRSAQNELDTLKRLSAEAPPVVSVSQGTEQYAQIIRGFNSGLTDEEIAQKLSTNPEGAKAIAACVDGTGTCDTAAFKSAAADFKISTELKDIETLKAELQANGQDFSAKRKDTPDGIYNPDSF